MHKKTMIAGSLGIIFLLVISFSGCVNQEEKIDPAIQKIKDADKLVVGTSTPYEPMEYTDENGDIIGFDIDVAREIASALDVKLEIKDLVFDDLLDAVEDGSVDIAIAAITITIDRSEQVLFSKAGEINAIVIDYPAGVGLIRDTSGLEIVGDPFTNELYGIAIKKGNSAVKTEIDKVIASISIEELGNKWF